MSNQLEKAYLELKKSGLTLEHIEEIIKMYGKSADTRYNTPKEAPKASEADIDKTIMETEIYRRAKLAIMGAQRKQVAYGIDKYPEPLNANTWDIIETIDHIIDESIDKLHYLTMLRIKFEQQLVSSDDKPRKHKDEMDAATYAMKILKDAPEQPLVVDNGVRVIPVKSLNKDLRYVPAYAEISSGTIEADISTGDMLSKDLPTHILKGGSNDKSVFITVPKGVKPPEGAIPVTNIGANGNMCTGSLTASQLVSDDNIDGLRNIFKHVPDYRITSEKEVECEEDH